LEPWNPVTDLLQCARGTDDLPRIIAKTTLALAGKSKTQIAEAIRAALDKGKLPTLEIGAMCYMMSKDGHLSDHDGLASALDVLSH
jgi:hypothetical protein